MYAFVQLSALDGNTNVFYANALFIFRIQAVFPLFAKIHKKLVRSAPATGIWAHVNIYLPFLLERYCYSRNEILCVTRMMYAIYASIFYMQQQAEFTCSQIFANLDDASHLQFLPAISMIILARQSITFPYVVCDMWPYLPQTSAQKISSLATPLILNFYINLYFQRRLVAQSTWVRFKKCPNYITNLIINC